MCVYLRAKFEVSIIIVTAFRRAEEGGGGVILPSPFPSPQNKHLNSPPRLVLTEKCKILLESKSYAGVVPVDPSKTFDTFNHDLLIAKLHAYGFPKKSLKLIKRYLSIRWLGTKINLSFSSFQN